MVQTRPHLVKWERNRASCGLFTAPEVRGSAKAGTVLRAAKAAVVPVHLAGRNRLLCRQKINIYNHHWDGNGESGYLLY